MSRAGGVQLQRPSRVLAGDLRQVAAIARCVVAWWPIASLMALVACVAAGSLRGAVLATIPLDLVWLRARSPRGVTDRLRAAWWRSWWWADARAVGFVAVADRHVNSEHESGGRAAAGLEVAPWLARVQVAGDVRTYRVRLLPGQTYDAVEAALPGLCWRWTAEVSCQALTDRYVLLEVCRADALSSPVTRPR